jgi:3-deoxy-7-phosphoheptulonate synthase
MDAERIIAGPCGVESEGQITAIARHISGLGVKILRGGIKKYRSRAETWQGEGARAVQWIIDVKARYGLKYCGEVFSAEDVSLYGGICDIMQIGARNMYNTDLLRAVNRRGGVVMLKRHPMASLSEFIAHAGYLSDCAVIYCLRGTLSIHSGEKRFVPDMYDIPRLRSMIGIGEKICYDVSHSACERRFVGSDYRCAVGYHPDYIMIETCPSPDHALSDGGQQVSLDDLAEIIDV